MQQQMFTTSLTKKEQAIFLKNFRRECDDIVTLLQTRRVSRAGLERVVNHDQHHYWFGSNINPSKWARRQIMAEINDGTIPNTAYKPTCEPGDALYGDMYPIGLPRVE